MKRSPEAISTINDKYLPRERRTKRGWEEESVNETHVTYYSVSKLFHKIYQRWKHLENLLFSIRTICKN